jgi:hypothetical protein
MTRETRRTLYLHTGTWKTGSTALQAHLNFNRGPLADLSVSYEFPADADPREGNGTYLGRKLLGQHIPTEKLIDILESYVVGRQIAICSSENFTSFGRIEWEQILDAAEQANLRIRVITYLRDVAPYYRAVHAQGLREGQIYCDLTEFSAFNSYAPVMASLRCILEVFGRDKMTPIHYESARSGVDVPFMKALGLEPTVLDNAGLARRVNRSFTNYEIKVLGQIIRKTGQRFASEVSTLLLERRPELEPDRSFDRELLEQLTRRHCDDLKWINDLLFGRSEVVRISETKDVASSKLPNEKVEQAIDKDIADWCMAKLESVQESDAAFLAERVANIDWRNIGHPALPTDFDPIAYLILNVDVLKAGVPPCEHYISSGQNEKNRRWRWEIR